MDTQTLITEITAKLKLSNVVVNQEYIVEAAETTSRDGLVVGDVINLGMAAGYPIICTISDGIATMTHNDHVTGTMTVDELGPMLDRILVSKAAGVARELMGALKQRINDRVVAEAKAVRAKQEAEVARFAAARAAKVKPYKAPTPAKRAPATLPEGVRLI